MSSRLRTDRVRAVATLVLAGLTWHTSAAADQGATEAEQLFYEARKQLDAQEYDEACEKLERSQKLDPGLGTLALLAYCHEMQGRTATAYAEYSQALRLAEEQGDGKRQHLIEKQRDRLKPRLSTLRVLVPKVPNGLEVYRAGKRLERSEWGSEVVVDPGTLEIEARAPGYQPWVANVSVGGDGARVDVSVPPLVRVASPAEPAGPRFDAPVLIAFGVGVVGVGAGAYFGLSAKSSNDDSEAHCDAESRCDREGFDLRKDAQSSARAANIAFGIGAAGIATGVVLLLVRGDGKTAAPETALRVRPAPNGAWAALEHAF
jgi:hypothetical protein